MQFEIDLNLSLLRELLTDEKAIPSEYSDGEPQYIHSCTVINKQMFKKKKKLSGKTMKRYG